ncbi:hypothetical protein, partial [Leptospira inadai]
MDARTIFSLFRQFRWIRSVSDSWEFRTCAHGFLFLPHSFHKTALALLFIFLYEFFLLPSWLGLSADPFGATFKERNKPQGRLDTYYDAAKRAKDESTWQAVVESGKRILSLEWEANASVEIEAELKKLSTGSRERDAKSAELDERKRTVKAGWQEDLNQEIESKRGVWRATVESKQYIDQFDSSKKDRIANELKRLVERAELAKNQETGDAASKLNAWDSVVNADIAKIRSDFWEKDLVQIGDRIRSSVPTLSDTEKASFEAELEKVRKYYENLFSLQETSIVLTARQNMIRTLNRDIDLSIARSGDPRELANLLIERTRDRIHPITGELLDSLKNPLEIPILFDQISSSDPQAKILTALQNGQALWEQAIQDLIVKKLQYDRGADASRVRAEEQWSRAYSYIVEQRNLWTDTISKQIEQGLKLWDASEAELQKNKQAATEELNRYIGISQEQFLGHLSGMENVLFSSSDTIKTIVGNISWLEEQIESETFKGNGTSDYVLALKSQRAQWVALQTNFRKYVSEVQDKIHNEDIRGTGTGPGLLDRQGGSDPYVYSVAEFDLKIAQAELAELERKKQRAEDVYSFALNHASTADGVALEEEKKAAEAAYLTEKDKYLALLKSLNESSALEDAKKKAEEVRKRLQLAQSDLDNAKLKYEQAKQLQILLVNLSANPGTNADDLLGEIGSVASLDSLNYPGQNENRGIRYEILQSDLQISEAREKLKQNEQVYFSKNYERGNALRSQSFFNDLWNRIQSFEASKTNLSLLEGVLADPDKSLLQKVDLLLDPSDKTLVTVYGNSGAQEIRKRLSSLKDSYFRTVNVAKEGFNPVQKPFLQAAIERYGDSFSPLQSKSSELLSQFTNLQKDQYVLHLGELDSVYSTLDALGEKGLDKSYLQLDSFLVYKNAYSSALGKWNDSVGEFTKAKTSFDSALAEYRAYASEHPNSETSPEHQIQIQKLTEAFGLYGQAGSKLESYWEDVSARANHLRYESLDRLTRATSLVDVSLLDLNTRKDLKNQFNLLRGFFSKKDGSGKEIEDDLTALNRSIGTKFAGFGEALSSYAAAFSGVRGAIEEKTGILLSLSSLFTSLVEEQRFSVTAQKAQLGFLTDEGASIQSLQETLGSVDLLAKTEAAKLDKETVDLLYTILVEELEGRSSGERRLDAVYLKLSSRLDAALFSWNGSADSIREIRAIQTVLSTIKNSYPSLSDSLGDDEKFAKLSESLAKSRTRSGLTLAFYLGENGFLSEADRTTLRMSDNENDRRKVSEFYSFGSTFQFGQQSIQSISGYLNLSNAMRNFGEGVKSGAILSGLRDDYFKEQEEQANGLFRELIQAAQIGSYTSQDFYKDSVKQAAGPDLYDSSKIKEKRTEFLNFLSGLGGPEEKLEKLLSSPEVLKNIFGNLNVDSIRTDLSSWKSEISASVSRFESYDTDLAKGFGEVSANFDSFLSFFEHPSKVWMHEYANSSVLYLSALFQMEDSNRPKQDAAPDRDGNLPGSPLWVPTYFDSNGKLPWEAGYNSGALRVVGYERTLSNLDPNLPAGGEKSALVLKKEALDDLLSSWSQKKTDLESRLGEYRSKLSEWKGFREAHPNSFGEEPEYLRLSRDLNELASRVLKLHSESLTLFNDTQTKFAEFRAEESYLLRQAKARLGLNSTQLFVPEYLLGSGNAVLPGPGLGSGIASLPADWRDLLLSDPGSFLKISGNRSELIQQLALLDTRQFWENSQYSSAGENGIYFTPFLLSTKNAGLQGAANLVKAKQNLWLSSLESRKAPVESLEDRISALQYRIVYYGEGSGPNRIGQEALISIVARIKEFLLDKSLGGVEFNPALTDVVNSAGAYTDEMENLKYLQSRLNVSFDASNASKTGADEAKKTVEEVRSLVSELSALAGALDRSGLPPYTSLGRIQSILEKYDSIQSKSKDSKYFQDTYGGPGGILGNRWNEAFESYRSILGDSEILLSEGVRQKLGDLREFAWESYKRNLVSSYLTDRVGNPVLEDFLIELKRGSYYAFSQSGGTIKIDSKFLGQSLREDQIQEIKSYLEPFDKKARIANAGIIADLDSFIRENDPELRSSLREFALVSSYAKVSETIHNGGILPDRDLPVELKDYALLASFEFFLKNSREEREVPVGTPTDGGTPTSGGSPANGGTPATQKKLVSKYDPLDANSRRRAMSDFLLKLGPVHKKDSDGRLVPDLERQAKVISLTEEYLSNYSSRNPSYYLSSQSLQDLEAKMAFYSRGSGVEGGSSSPSELSVTDQASLSVWILDRKYSSSEGAVQEMARIEFLLSHYYGESLEDPKSTTGSSGLDPRASAHGYFSVMDSYFESKGLAALTDQEKTNFKLLLSGAADPFGLSLYSPLGILAQESYLRNVSYGEEYQSFLKDLKEESKRLTKASVGLDALTRKEKFVNDFKRGILQIRSYESYLTIPYQGDPDVRDEARIEARLRELEKDAEGKLGGLFHLLETQKSFIFDQTKLADALPTDPIQTVADLNPGIRSLAKFVSSSYAVSDEVHSKNQDGKFAFEDRLVEIRSRMNQSVNVVSAGSVEYDRYAKEVGRQSGVLASLKSTITSAGDTYLVLRGLVQNGTDAVANLNAAYQGFLSANQALEGDGSGLGLKKEYENASNLVNSLQVAYQNQEKSVSDAYSLMLSKQADFDKKAALFDYFNLLEYSKHVVYSGDAFGGAGASDLDSVPAGLIDTPIRLAKSRKESAVKAYSDKREEVRILQARVDSQVTKEQLASETVSEKAEVTRWASLAVQFGEVESKIRTRISLLQTEIAKKESLVDQAMDRVWSIQVADWGGMGMISSLSGSLDFGGAAYVKTESWQRDKDRILDGLVTGRLGVADIVTAYNPGYSPAMHAIGLSSYDVGDFLQTWGKILRPASGPTPAENVFIAANSAAIWAWNPYDLRTSSGSGIEYQQRYDEGLGFYIGTNLFAANMLSAICWTCPAGWAYLNTVNSYNNSYSSLKGNVADLTSKAASLKSKYAELQHLTDIDTIEKLKSVLLEFGMDSSELDRLVLGSGKLNQLVWKPSEDPTASVMSFNDLVGSNGLRLAQQKAIHDEFGNFVRKDSVTAGLMTSAAEGLDVYGRKTSLMLSADEFVDALSVLARTQYSVARDAYYLKAESVVQKASDGTMVKVDKQVVWDDREQFLYDLMKKISKTTNGESIAKNIETEIYKQLISDYMGQSGVVSNLFQAELEQRALEQRSLWSLKETQFYDSKAEWVENLKYLKQTGDKRWDNMTLEFRSHLESWRKEWNEIHKTNQGVFLSRIESALEEKEKWTENFLRVSSQLADEAAISELYNSISGLVDGLKSSLPEGISLNANVNSILQAVLEKKPGGFAGGLIDRAKSIDTNFFLNAVKQYNFNDSGVFDKFKALMKETDKLSQNLVILQAFESLLGLPEAFGKAVQAQNEGVEKQMDSIAMNGAFARMGSGYVRQIKNAAGQEEIQA